MHAGPPKTMLCGVEIQGELKLDATVLTQFDTCALGQPASSLCFTKTPNKAVHFSMPKADDGIEPDADFNIYICTAPTTPATYKGFVEIRWCPSNAPGASFLSIQPPFCEFEERSYEDCGSLLYSAIQYPGPIFGNKTAGYIPVLSYSEHPDLTTDGTCATGYLVAVPVH